jgi:hypothetical protein
MSTTIASVQLNDNGEILSIVGTAVNMTANVNQYTVVADATAGAILVRLPSASAVPGRIYVVKKGDASANAVTITPNGTDLVEGGAGFSLTTQNDAVEIQSDGINNWHILSNNNTGAVAFSPWTTTAGVIHPIILGNDVSVGTMSSFGKFSVLGDTPAEITTVIRAAPLQVADIFVVEDNAGTDIFSVDTTGATVTGKLTVTGAIDPTSVLLSGGTALFFESNDGTTAPVSGAATGRIRYNDSTGTWQVSTQTDPYVDIFTVLGFRSVAASGAILTSDANKVILATAGGGGITLTLPSPASVTGQAIYIKKVDAAAGSVVIAQFAAETIDGASSIAISSQYESATVVSDGTNWHII